jgi:hypothetical protein
MHATLFNNFSETMKRQLEQNLKDSNLSDYASGGFCKLADLPTLTAVSSWKVVAAGIFTVVLDKRIKSFNSPAESITGFSVREAVGQYCLDIFRKSNRRRIKMKNLLNEFIALTDDVRFLLLFLSGNEEV